MFRHDAGNVKRVLDASCISLTPFTRRSLFTRRPSARRSSSLCVRSILPRRSCPLFFRAESFISVLSSRFVIAALVGAVLFIAPFIAPFIPTLIAPFIAPFIPALVRASACDGSGMRGAIGWAVAAARAINRLGNVSTRASDMPRSAAPVRAW
jgi:hypothetical protein